MDRAIVEAADQLSGVSELHDRLIIATAVVLSRRGMQVALVTRDENIAASGVVPVLW